MLVFGEWSLPDDDFNRLQQKGVAVKLSLMRAIQCPGKTRQRWLRLCLAS